MASGSQNLPEYLGSDRLVLASNNPGKITEFARLLKPLGLTVLAQGELNIPSPPEPFPSFIENALTKARHASLASGLPSLADDSGICVRALNHAPGIYSARYAGEHASDDQNNALLIKNLTGITDRHAWYVCALVLIRNAQDPEPIVISEQWHGEVIDTPLGEGGFGYDPYFYLPALKKTAAQLHPEEKNTISHRGRATQKLLMTLQQMCV